MYVGIEFAEADGGGLALVHKKWVTPRKTEVWWPPFKQQDLFDKSLKKGETPNENWQLFGVKRLFFEEENYSKALKKIKKAEFTSDVATDVDDEIFQKTKRISKPTRKLCFSSDEESGSDSEPPPKLIGLSPLLEISRIKTVTPSQLSSVPSTSYGPSPKQFLLPINESQSCLSSESIKTLTPSQLSRVPSTSNRPSPKQFLLPINESQSCLSTESDPVIAPEHGEVCDSSIIRLLKESNGYHNKTIRLLASIKLQNEQIIALLKEKTSASGSPLNLPEDFPINLPINDIRSIGDIEKYLQDEEKSSSLSSYFSTLGGKDTKTKVNIILKTLLCNQVAATFSFYGLRNQKTAFNDLKLKKVVTNSVLLTSKTSTEREIEDCIKLWLKQAPKRLKNAENRKNLGT